MSADSSKESLIAQVKKDLAECLLTVKRLFNSYYQQQVDNAKQVGLVQKREERKEDKKEGGRKGEKKTGKKSVEKGTEKDAEKERERVLIVEPDEQQQMGVAAAFTCFDHDRAKDLVSSLSGVSIPTIDKYLEVLKSPGNQDIVRYVKPNGRPRIYTLDADVEFVKWASDTSIPLNKKTMGDLILNYIKFLRRVSPKTRRRGINLNGVRQHIYVVLKFMNWCMVKPKAVDLQRCAIFERLLEWFDDEEVKDSLTSVPDTLLFNGDETHIAMDENSPRKVLWFRGDKNDAAVPRLFHETKHLSMFLVVSADGHIMKPITLVSPYVRGFDPLNNRDCAHFYQENGYMTKEVFYDVMKVFVKYVEYVRSYNDLNERRACLVVDGHISRYTSATVNLLLKHRIDLVILPSHSSHVVQPLDLGLFAVFKRVYKTAFDVAHPIFPLEAKSVGRPSTKRKLPLHALDNKQFEARMRTMNADMLRGALELPEDAEIRIGKAPYLRARMVEAILDAVSSLKPSAIRHAWNCCHLYPYYGTPNYTKKKEEMLLRQIPKVEKQFIEENKEQAAEVVEVEDGTEAATEDCSMDVVEESSAASAVSNKGSGLKRGRKSKTASTETGESAPKRRRRSTCEDKENQNRQANVTATETKSKRGKKGPRLYTGVLSNPRGRKWLEEYEKRDPEDKQQSETRAEVTISSQQGPLTLYDCELDRERELADPEDYFTALQEDVAAVIDPPDFLF